MEQLDFFDVPSPCVGCCQVNNRGYCKGCYRSRDERFYWQQMTADQKIKIIKLCRQRYLRIMRRQQQNKEQESVALSPQQQFLFDDVNKSET
ncbi:DUF1289 domain-containing protein [Photobacterium phosphoreum]|uniref:DUF1289 domain-containing protein n=1 Tax=Photobacterium phosphoreum TaxID=659 RepID=UPI000D1544B2|nr:DUF1289 domain-containing protein [Photobacterium phosphoreum]MCD9478861.1 DUF1289 domain-containing protein [Photobacterium phosphoreum]MCD9482962.1 DUF1289 domain-containing protein [Photobacterium phosphoreum]MCD9501205.1 DUF1289 domain-containing protein [Photobacterium phosphoreum]PSU40310.1 DUF1289 domain-containing protein [Photobacterium phosphoreum]PSU65680.1 DUF1289 domain-containing protein [Photobacterium phosphoreum]